MCLGIPGQVISLSRDEPHGLVMGVVDFGGIRKDVCLAYVPDVELGDYVIVHVGFAISRVDEEEARRTLEVLRAMDGVIETELNAREQAEVSVSEERASPAPEGAMSVRRPKGELNTKEPA